MACEITTSFSPEHFELAKLWARGLQTFWPDHPPVRIMSDGRVTDDQMREVADLCGGYFVSDSVCRAILRAKLPSDIVRLSEEVFWVRSLFQQYLGGVSETLIVDDVDGLFLRRPETWIAALEEFPDACISVYVPLLFIKKARALWAQVKPDLISLRREPTPIVGTHSAPRSLIADQVPLCVEYLRLWKENREGEHPASGAVCHMGLWQGLAGAHDPRVQLSPAKYQVDFLRLQLRPELYHSCSEKYIKWFWETFLVGYARHLDDPQDISEEAWWL
ncbi:MAG TPA: hypothetical protein VM243_12915 [Phycisphaerae bacterium]|nr:hypothetical protein [Phycisphaerae bacterium]